MKRILLWLISFAMVGMMASPNSSAQWVQTNGSFPTYVSVVVVSGSTVVAGSLENGVFISTDNGTSWKPAGDGLANKMGDLQALYVDSNGVGSWRIFAGGLGGGVFRSTDSGSSWESVDSGLGLNNWVYCFAVIGSNVVAGTEWGPFVSTNDGTSWQSTAYTRAVSSLCVNDSQIFAGTYGFGVVKSTDGGWTWQAAGMTDQDVTSLFVKGAYIFAGTNQGVFLSPDSGTTWQESDSGFATSYIYSITGVGSDIFVGTYDKDVFLSVDNGANWKAVNNGLTATELFSLAVNDSFIFAGTYPAAVWRRPLSEMIPAYTIENRWNIVSVASRESSFAKVVLYPSALSNAFAYQGAYVKKDTLAIGYGYWIKFDHPQTILLPGNYIATDSIEVVKGWNLIGSISFPVPTVSVTSDLPGMITSDFFGYENRYFVTDTIEPGKGYWVKVNQGGTLILSSSPSMASPNRIRRISTPELPPPPPEMLNSQSPMQFALEQNYPNPFNPITFIPYQLPIGGYVILKVYNILGQEVKTLVNELQNVGYKSVEWNATNNEGVSVPSGVYLYRLHVLGYPLGLGLGFSDTKKFVLLK